MKIQSLVFLAAVICLHLFLVGCSENSLELNQDDLSKEQKNQMAKARFQEKIAEFEKNPQKLTIEYATLEEINEVLLSYGLEPYSREDVERAKYLKSTWPCSTWINFGDISGNGVLSVLDVAMANNWRCANSGCSYNYDLFTDYVPSPYDNFAYMTGLGSDTDWYILNADDSDTATDFILGYIACS